MSQDTELAKFLRAFWFFFVVVDDDGDADFWLLSEGQIQSKEKLDFPPLVFGVVICPKDISNPWVKIALTESSHPVSPKLSTPLPQNTCWVFLLTAVRLLTQCVSYSWPGQAQWWCQTLQLHSQELLSQFKRGAEADQRGLLSTLPPRAALWRKLWLWNGQLEVLHMQFRENCEKVSWGKPFSDLFVVVQHLAFFSCKSHVIQRVLEDRAIACSCSDCSLHKGPQPEGWQGAEIILVLNLPC